MWKNCHCIGMKSSLYIFMKGRWNWYRSYGEISLLPTAYKILTHILLSVLNLYVNIITGGHQCGFRRNTSTADQIFCIRQILEKNGSIMGHYISYLQISRRPVTQWSEKYCSTLSLNLVYLWKYLG
jgi:hypothetical protein